MKTRPIVSAFVASVVLTLLMVLVTRLSAAEPDAVIRSTFDADVKADGWTVLGNNPVQGGGAVAPDWVETGGNPGGFIRETDQATGPVWYWNAPAKFKGPQSANYGGSLSFDLYQLPDMMQPIVGRADVILQGQGINLEYDTPTDPNTTWTHYSVPLSQDGRWLRVTSGITGTPDVREPATNDQIKTVLSNVGTLRIRGEYRQEGDAPGTVRDTGGLDNVVLAGPGDVTPTTTVPSPTVTTVPSPTATTVPSPTATTAPVSRQVYLPLVVR